MAVLSLARNQLAGAAFPAAWLRPGAFPVLTHLLLGGNGRLVGALPPSLAWPNLKEL